MTFAQVKAGQKLHLVYEAGEGSPMVRRGYISRPLCGRKVEGGYRMTINVPLNALCKNCRRVARSRGEY